MAVSKYQAENEELKKQIEELNVQIEKLKTSETKHKKTIKELKAAVKNATQTIIDLQTEIDDKDNVCNSLKNSYEQYIASTEEKINTLNNIVLQTDSLFQQEKDKIYSEAYEKGVTQGKLEMRDCYQNNVVPNMLNNIIKDVTDNLNLIVSLEVQKIIKKNMSLSGF